MAICKGCGVKLQSQDKNSLGYTPKADSEYCQRCFRIRHYDDVMYDMKQGIDPKGVFEKIKESEGYVVWVVDLFDFEASMIEDLNEKIGNKKILLVGSKRDLLPITVKDEKLTSFIYERLSHYHIHVDAIAYTSLKQKESYQTVYDFIEKRACDKQVIVIGKANVGKSTFINQLLQKDELTNSRYPGTTLAFHAIAFETFQMIDTPGIEVANTYLQKVDNEALKKLVPYQPIKPETYQIHANQTFFIAGLCRIDVAECDASCTFYRSLFIPIHRTNTKNADALWKERKSKLSAPILHEPLSTKTFSPTGTDKYDIVIDGIGWMCFKGTAKSVTVHTAKDIRVTFRKAMI